MRWYATEFSAMGSPCHLVTDNDELARLGEQRIHELEATWSRFSPASEVSALNTTAGSLCVVSAATFELISRAEQARKLTGGVFNPLMGAQIVELGYDRPWPLNTTNGPTEMLPVRMLPAGMLPVTSEPIELFAEVSAVRLPAGSMFDPGGIGKGLAADLVTAELLTAGASSVQVSLGGDVRVAGPSWAENGWHVQLNGGYGMSPVAVALPDGGGVATSSVLRRRWLRDGNWVHHLLDPDTGASAATPLASATVVAAETWWAEVVAKVVMIEGTPAAVEQFGLSAVLWPESGSPTHMTAQKSKALGVPA